MRSVPYYTGHKWLGVAVVAASLLHVIALIIKPNLATGAGRAWAAARRAFGCAVAAAGVANVFIGAVLMHGYKRQPYAYWLAPAAACVGAVVLLAALLEAIKIQLQRTHRYYPKTDQMFDVSNTFHHSSKRGGAGGGAGPAAATVDVFARSEAGGSKV
jgi:hypothetical protein